MCEQAAKAFQGKIPILGICLGHQAICEAYGAVIVPAEKLMHGKKSWITLAADCELFAGMEREMDDRKWDPDFEKFFKYYNWKGRKEHD